MRIGLIAMSGVRVRTQAGWLVLASDAAHFYENFLARKPFPIVVDLQNMLDGFEMLRRLASAPRLIVPGHDPHRHRPPGAVHLRKHQLILRPAPRPPRFVAQRVQRLQGPLPCAASL